ncbi:hypothetical protein Tco_1462291, partial [Tanacetum coccineum]
FINTVTVIRKEGKSREAGAIKSNAGEELGRNTIVEVTKKAEEGLDSFETEVEEVEMESEEPEEEIKEETEEEEEDDPEYFDTFPTIEELGNFTYECDFVVVEDTTSVIDHYLGGMVLGKPFVKETGLVYNKEEGTVIFKKGNEKVIFKMPHKMERFKHIDFEEMKTDFIPPFVIEGNDDDHEKTY